MTRNNFLKSIGVLLVRIGFVPQVTFKRGFIRLENGTGKFIEDENSKTTVMQGLPFWQWKFDREKAKKYRA